MIQVEGLTKYYGPVPAIMDVSFRVEKGEIVAFLGPNGAGKTTTMRILTGFMPATLGTARIAGIDVYEDSIEARRHIGYMPETTTLYTDMRVHQYLRYCGKLQGMRKPELADRLDLVMDQCGLSERRDAIIGTLSLGFRQRVGLAQALIHNPDVLILDEPTVGLDPNQIMEVRQLIKNLAGQHTVMLSTHILPEAQMTCERVIIINHGKIVAEDTPENLTAQIREVETIVVEVATDDGSVPRLLQDIPEVSSVRRLPDESRNAYLVDTRLGTDIRSQIAEFVVGKGWGLLELRPVEMSLEDVFRQLTTEEKGVA
ncbi:MAG: ATP-binding cassette domain-containing protein [Armatimonadetes bacterium]|jgi:ABC-2 type transport system ATP-binding protein|nr:ATP-binding cassette domain-containing protein [Armatimonadota bacterium]MDI9583207.1 ATP-binding cassette domain-containing protein [Acidobacteriota bacterium]